ncbi:MAG: glycosyltransferase family 2 protein [Deinococcus sp.]|nr:glycosyltransferase family 2 protein [Deinococcus sp.]
MAEQKPELEQQSAGEVEVSVVMPCLNEEQSIGQCVRQAREALKSAGLKGEVVMSDNGSTDRSVAIAQEQGARVVHQSIRGYGAAYLQGIRSARGRYIVIGDSDGTYPFERIPDFVARLREGFDLVMGSRLKGQILPGAMPWLHRSIGNPLLSGILRLLFGGSVSDAHCGMRAFTKEAFQRLRLHTTGMEFASEMVINALKARLRIAEIPITYSPRHGQSKLHSLRDGWRHLRFMLLRSPTALFVVPGALFIAAGLVVQLALLGRQPTFAGVALGAHSATLGSFLAILGFQVAFLGLCARTVALSTGLEQEDRLLQAFYRGFTLERGVLAGALLFLIGFVQDALILRKWVALRFGPLQEIHPAIFALTLMALGAQLVFASFLLSVLRLPVPVQKNSGS